MAMQKFSMDLEKVISYRRKVMKVGGSVVVPLPKEIRRVVNLGVGDMVDVFINEDGQIILKKVERAWSGRITRKD